MDGISKAQGDLLKQLEQAPKSDPNFIKPIVK